MESTVNSEVRQLCRAVAEEQDPDRIKILLDDLLQVLNERELLASLL
jgi:hypothetical protein